jgi:hypothetical protein
MEPLQTISVSKTRMELCLKVKRLILLPQDLEGGAWQLRADDLGNIVPNDVSTCVPSDKVVAHWSLTMIEVNWDYHLASVRHLWKDNPQVWDCVQHLLKALTAVAILNKVHRNAADARPPIPTRYPADMTSAAAPAAMSTDEPLIVWLAPTWR